MNEYPKLNTQLLTIALIFCAYYAILMQVRP